ncbi:unnamed protein product [Boreogadus saida]
MKMNCKLIFLRSAQGDLLLRPTVFVTRPRIHVWRSRADGGVVLKALPGGGADGGPARPGLWLRRADGGAKTLEDDITLPTRILESGGLLEKLCIWKANPEDNQNSTIKDSSQTHLS